MWVAICPLHFHLCLVDLVIGGKVILVTLCVQGLPVRGQTTKNNARTRKGKAKPIAGKKK